MVSCHHFPPLYKALEGFRQVMPHLGFDVMMMLDVRIFYQHQDFMLPTVIEGTRPVVVMNDLKPGTNPYLQTMVQDPVYVVVILPVMEEDRIKTSDRL